VSTATDRPAAPSARPVTTPRSALRRVRLPLAVLGLLVAASLLLALLGGVGRTGDLTPDSPSQGGAQALARLLEARGVPVTRVGAVRPVDTVEPAGAQTLFAPDTSRLADGDAAALLAEASSHDVVAVVTDEASRAALGLPPDTPRALLADVRAPGCAFAPAATAGPARTGGAPFPGSPPAGFRRTDACYPTSLGPTLVRYQPQDGSGSLVLLADPAFLRNDRLAEAGNAALALGLLDRGRPVRWVLPPPGEAGGGEGEGILALLPHRLYLGLAELGVVVALLALWRGRRLGPVVVEPLPVVVRSVETVRGRSRLYRAARARDRAALALREAARARAAARLGLGPETPPPVLVDAVAAAAGRAAGDVGNLLYGAGAPADDPALVRLADDLDLLGADLGRRP